MAKKRSGSSGGRSLVIVESPAKAKTINKYLGSNYVVKACKGHVRDLPKHRYGIDPGRNFEPSYELLPSHKKVIGELRGAAAEADIVFLATDRDREGEAIAWHLVHALELKPGDAKRVVFNEITKSAIQQAFANPHEIDADRVNAQQARRILDRIVGYELSPLLWKKVAKGLSAGRVQSVSVRMIVDREDEIRRFEPQESWVVEAILTTELDKADGLSREWREFLAQPGEKGSGPTVKEQTHWLSDHHGIRAELIEIAGKPFDAKGRLIRESDDKYRFESAVESVRPIVEALGLKVREVRSDAWPEYERLGLRKVSVVCEFDRARAAAFAVRDIETRRSRTKPPPPFTTASLQQAAANQLRFATSRTMKIAQALYEGIDLKDGEGPVGLITYMRTDSTNLSAESVAAVRDFIGQKYGPRYLPDQPNRYGSAKSAQEAHEAIRPTDVGRTPNSLKGHLSEEQLKLYTLIWNRFVACQMPPAEWDATTARIAVTTPAGEALFKAAGRVLIFDGFYRVLGVPRADDEPTLPALKPQQPLAALDVEPIQKFTQPPPRFTEASLVKALEAEGIGRPSTYAAIIDTIQKRGYVEQVDRRFHPTARGEVVTRKLVDHFPQVMDLKFTSHMEEQLDKIEEAHLDWVAVLHEFYDPFREALGKAHEEMDAVRAEPSPYVCDKCGKPMVYRFGRNGRFLSCTGYPECKAAMNVDNEGRPVKPVEVDVKCEKCGRPMQLRRSRGGYFLGCTGYPECSSTAPCDDEGRPLRKIKAEEIKDACPECGAPMRVNFFRGRSFLGCSKYPTCRGTKDMPPGVYVEKPPAEQAGVNCDKCGRPMVIRKSRRGPFISCSGYPKCRNAVPMEKLEALKAAQAAAGAAPPADNASEAAARGASEAPAARRKSTRGKTPKTAARKAADVVPPATADASGLSMTRNGKVVVETMEGPVRCPSCGSEMVVKAGRWGPFLSCTGFPRCRMTGRLKGEALKKAEEQVGKPEPRAKPIPTDVKCPECGSNMMLRMGRTGRFLGCGAYPKCKKTMEPPPGLLREVGANGG